MDITMSSSPYLQLYDENQIAEINAGRNSAREGQCTRLYRLGGAEIILAALILVINIISIILAATFKYPYPDESDLYYPPTYNRDFSAIYVSPGIWCGIPLLVSGIMGMRARNISTVCMFNANLVFSIIAAMAMGILVPLCGVASAFVKVSDGIRTTQVLMTVLGFTGLLVSVLHAVFCCTAVCCHRQAHQGETPVTSPQSSTEPNAIRT